MKVLKLSLWTVYKQKSLYKVVENRKLGGGYTTTYRITIQHLITGDYWTTTYLEHRDIDEDRIRDWVPAKLVTIQRYEPEKP